MVSAAVQPAGRAAGKRPNPMDAFKAQMLDAVKREDAPGRLATSAVLTPPPDAPAESEQPAAPVTAEAPQPTPSPKPEPAAAEPAVEQDEAARPKTKKKPRMSKPAAEPLPLIEQFTVSLDASELKALTRIKGELQERGIIGHKIADAWLMRLALRAWNPGEHNLAADVAAMRAADGRGKR